MGDLHPEFDAKEINENINYEEVHPESLNEKVPETFEWFFYSVVGFVTAYGWFLLIFICLGYYAWKALRPKYERWIEDAELHKNPDKFIAREIAISEARKRMQEKYDADAIEVKRKEEEKRLLNDSRSPDVRRPQLNSRTGLASNQNTDGKSSKPRLRPAFNPMMADTSSSCGWRRSTGRRSGGG